MATLVTFIAAAFGIEIVLSKPEWMDVLKSFHPDVSVIRVFGLALFAAGQSSTFTGTMAGQVLLQGFMSSAFPVGSNACRHVLRRTFTRQVVGR